MPLRPDLLAAYKAAHYVVFGKTELVIRIGEPNPDLDALLETDGATTAAYATAANPRGRRRSVLKNKIAFSFLKRILKKRRYVPHLGTGRDPDGRWPPEPSMLIVGIYRANAQRLGRLFEQNAIVFVEKGKAPELVVLV